MKIQICMCAIALATTSIAAESIHTIFSRGPDAVTLKFVKKRSGPVDAKDNSECTTLHYAARYGRLETAKWLIAHKADVNTVSYNRFTPMHMARDNAMARLLIQSGADLKKKDSWGKNPLQKSAFEKNIGVSEAILASGFPMDLASALWLGRRDLAVKMIQENSNLARQVNGDWDLFGNTSPLGIAAQEGDTEVVELLLKAGAPVNAATGMPNAGQVTALCNAVWSGHYKVAEILCKAGADCNVTGGKYYPRLLDYVRKHSKKEMVDLLIKHGAKPSEPLR